MKFKKSIIGILTIVGFMVFGKVEGATSTQVPNVSDIGYTTDIVRTNMEIKNSVFKDDFRRTLTNQAAKNISYKRNSISVNETSSSKTIISRNISSQLKNESQINCLIDGVFVGASSSTMDSNSITTGLTTSSMYSYYGYYYRGYETSINKGEFSPNKSDYTQMYLNDLEILQKNKNSYELFEEFFDNYGTHVLSSILYGGKTEAIGIFCSKDYTFSKNQEDALDDSLSASFADMVLGSSYQVKLSSEYYLKETIDAFKINFKQFGGDPGLEDISLSNYTNKVTINIKNWEKSLGDSSKCVAIAPGNDGLIPLWNVLPFDKLDLRDTMIYMFKQYKEKYNNEIDDFYNTLNTGRLPKQLVRDYSVTITDSGRLKQHKDFINCNSINGLLSFKEYKKAGYKKCNIKIQLDYKNEDFGEQRFLLYSKVPDSSDTSKGLLDKWYKSKSSWSWSNITLSSNGISIDELLDDGLVIMYSAAGKLNDDWKVDDVYVSFTFSK